MTTRRTAKASRAIREVVSSAILFELNDPRIQDVTVLNVEVAADMRTAKVYVSVMGEEKHQSRAVHGLNSARGFLQKKVADRIDTRYTPVLTFVLDQSVKKSIETSRILRELKQDRDSSSQEQESEETGVSESDPQADLEQSPERQLSEEE